MTATEPRIRSTAPTLVYVVVFVVVCGTVAGLVFFNHPPFPPAGSESNPAPGKSSSWAPLLDRAFAVGVDRPLAERLNYAVLDEGHGTAILLRDDPDAAGKKLFGQHCASCHNFGADFHSDKSKAADLKGFGTKPWIAGLLADPGSPAYFGHTSLDGMTKWVQRTRRNAAKDKQTQQLEADFDTLAGWLASHPRAEVPRANDPPSTFARGYGIFYDYCSECHSYKAQSARDALTAPDLAGYGDADWVRLMILSPNHVVRYSVKNTMPLFRDLDGPEGQNTRQEVARLRDYLLIQLDGDDPRREEKLKQIENSTHLANLSGIDRELIIRYVLQP
ncbi:MAG: hypothetical protein AB7K24_21225 [Gemmataceae bacterium]